MTKNLGHVTAYAYAKSKGYTGTEEEFAAEQAQFARNAQQVAEDAEQVAADREAVELAKTSVEETANTFETETVPEAVQSVQDEGTTQVAAVNEAGGTQVGAVEEKGQQVLDSIPEDYTELSGDVTQLKADLSQQGKIYDAGDSRVFAVVDGYYVNVNNGNFVADARYSRTDFVECKGGELLTFNVTRRFTSNAFYDENKAFISAFTVNSGDRANPVIAPENAKYLVLSSLKDNVPDTIIYKDIPLTIFKSDYDANVQRIQNGELPYSIVKFSSVSSSGAIVTDSGYARTTPIAVTGGEVLSVTAAIASTYNAFYDSNMDFISRFSVSVGENVLSIPANAHYVVFAFSHTSPLISVKKVMPDNDGWYENNALYFERSRNLFDKTSENIIENKNIASSGALVTDNNSSVSDYIPVVPNAHYTLAYIKKIWDISNNAYLNTNENRSSYYTKNRNNAAFYDENKILIGATSAEPWHEPKTPSNCRYMRIAFAKEKIDTCVVMPGSVTGSFAVLYSDYEPSTAFAPGLDASRIASTGLRNYDDLQSFPIERTMRSIARLGFNIMGTDTPPQHTIESFDLAYKHGFDTIVADLAFTSDNVPVCFHDRYINDVYNIPVYSDGTIIDNTDHSITISSHTYDEWNDGTYDFGLYKGERWRGTKLLKVEQFIRYCKAKGISPNLEMKAKNLTTEQIQIICNMLKKYNMESKTTVFVDLTPDDINALCAILAGCPKMKRAGFFASGNMSAQQNTVAALKNAGAEQVVIWYTASHILTQAEYEYFASENVEYETGHLDSESAIIAWLNSGYNYYCTGIESSFIVATRAISDYADKLIGE